MNFAEQPPSKQWAALKYRGEKFAEVWFKPEGNLSALIVRILQGSFHIPGMVQHLTAENLLKAVGIAPEEVESWHHGEITYSVLDGSSPELKSPLPPPDDADLDILICLQTLAPPSQVLPAEDWQTLASCWKTILGLEASLETMRINTEGLLAEMEGCCKKSLAFEEKIHAKRTDVSEWTKARTRVHNAIPKVRDFIHRATWALGSPERKQLAEIFKGDAPPPTPLPPAAKLLVELENLQKDRQILAANGVTVSQEAKGLVAVVQQALRTLQSNAAANATSKRAGASGGKFFKSVRKMSGAE